MSKKGFKIAPGARAQEGESVILSIHGGGFSRSSAHPSDYTANIPRGILQHSTTVRRAFTPEYRLVRGPATAPTHPFPTQLIDAVAAYSYLVNDLGFSPEHIIVEGDSAGGGLVLALARYLVEQTNKTHHPALPRPPGSIVLVSPWCDMGIYAHDPASSFYKNVDTDIIDPSSLDFVLATLQYTGGAPYDDDNDGGGGGNHPRAAETNRYISPASSSPLMAHVSFDGFPRAFVVAGGSEAWRDQIRVLRRKMMARDGGEERVAYFEAPDAFHCFVMLPFAEPERTEALTRVAKWIDNV